MSAWQEFLKESNRAMRVNDLHHGVVYAPDPLATTRDMVKEYVLGFGWTGVSTRDVSLALNRDQREVGRELEALVKDGEITMELELTRGPLASRRKKFASPMRESPFFDGIETDAAAGDLYFEGTPDEHAA